EHTEFVGRTFDTGDDAPVAAKHVTLEETDSSLGVADVEDEDHVAQPNELSEVSTSEPARTAVRPASPSTRRAPSARIPTTTPGIGATQRRPAARSRAAKSAISSSVSSPLAATA